MLAVPYSRYVFGTLPWYSVLIVSGICAALILAFREEKRLGLPKDTTVDLALWVIPFGIIGARLYYVVFQWDLFRNNPIETFKIWQGGLAIYGGVIGGLIGAAVYSRMRRIPFSRLTDLAAPGLPLAQAIGRWGNYFNMEAYGAPIINPAWQFFPAGVLIKGSWYMATFFYESMWNLTVFILLMLTRRRMRRPGDAFLWYAMLYGAGRFVIEGFRTDSLMLGRLRVSRLLSLGLCVAVFLIFSLRAIHSGQGHTPIAAIVIAAVLTLGPVAALMLSGTGSAVLTLLPSLVLPLCALYTYRMTSSAATEV